MDLLFGIDPPRYGAANDTVPPCLNPPMSSHVLLRLRDVGIAEGLAKTGLLPIATTFAVCASRRAFDQMVISMGTGPSRGIVIGFAPGTAMTIENHNIIGGALS